ncbi:MAG TPA: T9SS type A sorting domain-containing protein [Saprospiraceae bacterium]|nr:T9SS type A sorting domain-containing protein [Saprospiraceae bacterium]
MKKPTTLLLIAFFTLLLTQLQAQQFFFSQEQPSNCNASDGIITLVPTRGVPPFSYLWSTGSTEVSLRNIPKGAYSATMTDASGATISHTFILNSEELDVRLTSSLPAGGCNPNSGMLHVEPVGGQAPFSYTWSTGSTDAKLQGLTSGLFSVTVQDANGCTAKGEYQVTNQSWLYNIGIGITIADQPDCINLNNGALSVQFYYNNIYPPYTYLWSNGGTDQTISNLAKGAYSVTVTDAIGCTATSSFFLDNKINTTSNVICSGDDAGAASAQLVNASGPVNYAWSNGQNGPSLNGLTDGFYSVTATDALGCVAVTQIEIAAPFLYLYDFSKDCFSGNAGRGSCQVANDLPISYLWDNGETTPRAHQLSVGTHSITVTTSLGCTLTETLVISPPTAPDYSITSTTTPANCAQNLGGSIDLNISGGMLSYNVSVYGPEGFLTSDINSLNNLQSGDYYVSVRATGSFECYGGAEVHVADAGGFEPSLVVSELNCSTGIGDAAIINVIDPNVQYEWSTGSTGPAVFNLTAGCYTVSVTGSGSCVRYLDFCFPYTDTVDYSACMATVTGQLINDQGLANCQGTTGIPYQLIRTMPSGALNFTDHNGDYVLGIPNGTYSLDAPQYGAGDIACPAGGVHTVNGIVGQVISGLDFHFLNTNAQDLRIQQKPLRSAQPGYPYSIRVEVCNDGNTALPGAIDLEYGNLLGTLGNNHFAQHPGAIVLNSEVTGSPNNQANFNLANLAPGACELLQLDLLIGTGTAVNSAFITEAQVSPGAGDPTPANNLSTLYNTVMGSFDPNCVLAYPARNGTPKYGGDIFINQDKTITYQIIFQNTGTAPADLVMIRENIDPNLDIASIRNISASHNMKILTSENNQELIFKFDNIGLPDSTSDYAGSIGSIQYQIDLKPGLPLGTKIKKQAAIFFDFNSPVITNENVLLLVKSDKVIPLLSEDEILLFPNPADDFTGFYCDGITQMDLYDTAGRLILSDVYEPGLKQLDTANLPNAVYLMRLNGNGKIRSGKLVVSH